ncbi:hypothetical protein POTOM_000590 [Populus tomentosa]|uniref:Uncharacterized protein n=1 Tax=Populus tomentosa TaxID=118781 RepID=A0A8X8DGC9_POPTO|nr:hypothetical protein POTOM_000590 [Populus tomentosa]
MAEINEGQERIRDGQKEVREKFEEISKETAKLKEETNIISKQSAANQVRLDLMFQIIKARSENDARRDAVLTQILRVGLGFLAEEKGSEGEMVEPKMLLVDDRRNKDTEADVLAAMVYCNNWKRRSGASLATGR